MPEGIPTLQGTSGALARVQVAIQAEHRVPDDAMNIFDLTVEADAASRYLFSSPDGAQIFDGLRLVECIGIRSSFDVNSMEGSWRDRTPNFVS